MEKSFLSDSRNIRAVTIASLVGLIIVLALFGQGMQHETKRSRGGAVIQPTFTYPANDRPATRVPAATPTIRADDAFPSSIHLDGTPGIDANRRIFSPHNEYLLFWQDDGRIVVGKNDGRGEFDGLMAIDGPGIGGTWSAEWANDAPDSQFVIIINGVRQQIDLSQYD